MVVALYRHRHSHAELRLELPGTVLDFAALDAAAALKWGPDIIRLASWLRP